MSIEYPLTFKAAILENNSSPLVIDQVTFKGPLEPGHVLVRIHYSGICGKQIEEIQGSGGNDPYIPHMLGHEGSGIVVDVGPGVTKVVPGDYVVLHWVKGSGIDSSTPFYTRFESRVNAGCITTFNEYGVVSENRVTVIPKETDLSIACLLGCAVTTGVGSVFNDVGLLPGQSVVIFGCGGVGLCAVQAAALLQGDPIIAIDRYSENLQKAYQFGATHTLNSLEQDVVKEVKRITNGEGSSSVVITVGNPQAIEVAVDTCAAPGTVIFVSVPPANSKITIDPLQIHRRRTMTGSYGGGSLPDRDVPEYLKLHQKGSLKLKELISHTLTLDNINEGIEKVISGCPGRCIVKMVD